MGGCVRTSMSRSCPCFSMNFFVFSTYAELLYFVWSLIPVGLREPANLLDGLFFSFASTHQVACISGSTT